MPPMWRSILATVGSNDHIVQLYREPEFLEDALRIWLNQSLEKDGGVLTLTTRESRPRIERALEDHGHHVDHLEEKGRLVMLDVDEFLERFNASGVPDPVVFNEIINQSMKQLRDACGHQPIHAWGEAVETLRRRGQAHEASLLEVLWTEATQAHDFSLLCSYNLDILDLNTHQGMMAELTEAHTHRLVDPYPERLDEAVHHALDELYGEAAARLIWTGHHHHGSLALDPSTGACILEFAISTQTREQVEELFTTTRKHYNAHKNGHKNGHTPQIVTPHTPM